MAQKKNTWLWIAGGVALAWWLMRKKRVPKRSGVTPPGPRRQVQQGAADQAREIVSQVNFVPDMPTDQEIYKASQKDCK